MNRARAWIAPLSLAIAAGLCALCGPALGSPGPLVMAALLAASVLASTAGFAFSAIAGAALFRLIDDPVQVVQLLITCSIANQVIMVSAMHREISWRQLAGFVAGGMLGLPVGIWVLLHAERRSYLVVLGLMLLLYSVWMLVGPRRSMPLRHPALDLVAGFLGGITGGAAAFPSAPVTMLCQLRGQDKMAQRAVFQPFILVMQLAATVMIALLRPSPAHHASFDPSLLLCLPAALLGTWMGMAWFRRMSNRQFGITVNVLLIVSGLSYVL